MSIVTDQPRVATLVCEGEVRALTIGRREFEAILRDRPQVAQGIIRVLCARLAEAQRAA
jgi:CRP-like cAMP-binding protein